MMRRVQVAGMTAVILLGLGMLARHVNAYTTNGHAWGVKQVPYYINPQNLYVSESAALAAITSAAAAWRGVANIDLVYAGNTNGSTLANNGKNEVFFRDDVSSHIAETYWWYDGTGHLVDADIVLHESSRFYSANIGCNGDGFYIENTGAHEFGHVLGLAHSDVDTASMWAYSGACETIRETLDSDDIAGLVSLYPGSSSPAPTTPPSAPSGLGVGVSASNPTSSLVLAWVDNSTDETGFRVERSANGSSFSQIAQLGSGANSYVDSGLPSGTTFYYRVYAYNNGGASAYSNVASNQTQAAAAPAPAPAPSAPSAPASPSPANGATNVNTNVSLSWTASNATNYDVYFKGALVASNLTTTSYRIGSVPDGTQYSWQVVAKNAAGSTSGPAWSFTTKVSPGKKK